MSGEIPESELDAMRAAVDALPRRRDQLLPALLAAEHALGWLPEPAIGPVVRVGRAQNDRYYCVAIASAASFQR